MDLKCNEVLDVDMPYDVQEELLDIDKSFAVSDSLNMDVCNALNKEFVQGMLLTAPSDMIPELAAAIETADPDYLAIFDTLKQRCGYTTYYCGQHTDYFMAHAHLTAALYKLRTKLITGGGSKLFRNSVEFLMSMFFCSCISCAWYPNFDVQPHEPALVHQMLKQANYLLE